VTLTELFSQFPECPTVQDLSFDYDCGDKRSYGGLKVSFRLGERSLKFDFSVGSGGGVENVGGVDVLVVDGQPVELDNWPEVEVPHYYAGVKACDRWEERAPDTLVEDFQEWVQSEWEGAQEV